MTCANFYANKFFSFADSFFGCVRNMFSVRVCGFWVISENNLCLKITITWCRMKLLSKNLWKLTGNACRTPIYSRHINAKMTLAGSRRALVEHIVAIYIRANYLVNLMKLDRLHSYHAWSIKKIRENQTKFTISMLISSSFLDPLQCSNALHSLVELCDTNSKFSLTRSCFALLCNKFVLIKPIKKKCKNNA